MVDDKDAAPDCFTVVECALAGLGEMPEDYEPCGECGHDHAYEQEDARRWHDQQEEARLEKLDALRNGDHE